MVSYERGTPVCGRPPLEKIDSGVQMSRALKIVEYMVEGVNIFIELMTSDRKLQASRKGSK